MVWYLQKDQLGTSLVEIRHEFSCEKSECLVQMSLHYNQLVLVDNIGIPSSFDDKGLQSEYH